MCKMEENLMRKIDGLESRLIALEQTCASTTSSAYFHQTETKETNLRQHQSKQKAPSSEINARIRPTSSMSTTTQTATQR